jgi:hypothetical protein
MSNYEKLVEAWRLKFLEMDKERLLRILPELSLEGEYFALSHYRRRFGMHSATGHIVPLEDNAPVSSYTKLNIYTLFGYATPEARLTGDFVAFADLKDASPFKRAFDQSILHPLAQTFSGKEEDFARACERLGGRKLPGSGMKYEVDAFLCMPVRFLFWDGDEEFPAQANILFDRSATDFTHVESVVTVASEGMFYLAEAAGLELKGSPLFRP